MDNTALSTQTRPCTRSVFHNPIHFIAFGFGSGLLPKIPGTYGTLVAIPIYLIIANTPLWLYASVTLLLILFSIYACGITARDIGVHDYPGIVLDEIVGYLLTMLAVPANWLWILLGFVLFRVFDIWKPWPIRWIDQRVTGGLGIVLDDLLAAVYAWLILQALVFVWVYYE